jgi:hypothetical protein
VQLGGQAGECGGFVCAEDLAPGPREFGVCPGPDQRREPACHPGDRVVDGAGEVLGRVVRAPPVDGVDGHQEQHEHHVHDRGRRTVEVVVVRYPVAASSARVSRIVTTADTV